MKSVNNVNHFQLSLATSDIIFNFMKTVSTGVFGRRRREIDILNAQFHISAIT
jgi:hypothetical protein